MSIVRKLAIAVIFGVLAIVGSGVAYDVFGGYMPVVIYIVLLLTVLGGFISR
jgi:hypothetical protein